MGWPAPPLTKTTSCSSRRSPARRTASAQIPSRTRLRNSCSPHSAGSVSWNEEWPAAGRMSQFQPPSAHCDTSSCCTRSATRGSSARPSRHETATALPSCDACRRTRPSTTGTAASRWGSAQNPRMDWQAEIALGSRAGRPSSTRDTSRQCAPRHFAYGREEAVGQTRQEPVHRPARQRGSGRNLIPEQVLTGERRYSRISGSDEPRRPRSPLVATVQYEHPPSQRSRVTHSHSRRARKARPCRRQRNAGRLALAMLT